MASPAASPSAANAAALREPLDLKRWLLWGSLVAAALLLLYMAVRLASKCARAMRAPRAASAHAPSNEVVPAATAAVDANASAIVAAAHSARDHVRQHLRHAVLRHHRSARSHGPAIGCVVDGCPPGLALAEADIQPELDRRKPGTSRHVTQRHEADTVEILSGVFEGRTTGTPIALLIRNDDQRSKDYANIADTFRPGPRRLHLLAQVRHARSARRRRAVGARDGAVRVGGRRDRAQVAARAATA